MRKIIALLVLVACFSISAFASKDLVSAVKPVVKHPALITRSYHGLKFVGKKSGHAVKVATVKTYEVGKKILF